MVSTVIHRLSSVMATLCHMTKLVTSTGLRSRMACRANGTATTSAGTANLSCLLKALQWSSQAGTDNTERTQESQQYDEQDNGEGEFSQQLT